VAARRFLAVGEGRWITFTRARGLAILDDVGLASRQTPSRSICLMVAMARSRRTAGARSRTKCCCATSHRRHGSLEDIGPRIAALIKKVAANRTVLMVEHNLSVVSDLCDAPVADARAGVTEGDYATGLRRPERPRGLHGNRAMA